jgi:hypothetical protein
MSSELVGDGRVSSTVGESREGAFFYRLSACFDMRDLDYY